MGLLDRLLRFRSGSVERGIHLNYSQPYWELSAETDFPAIFSALPDLLPADCILYFENGSPSGELAEFLQKHQLSEPTYVEPGSWPWPKGIHIPATAATLHRLSVLSDSCASPELAVHFHVYRERTVLLECHDVFSQSMLLSTDLESEKVTRFANRLGLSLTLITAEQSTDDTTQSSV